ncbi:sterol desaturase family protein [Caenimonas sp. SL110]|uniref:sterol desaturase family protein n=1 Tax=Caenimonas sp. SL110 TaxID=1450524 RepID=UPI000653A7F6|nr:sterol desaturase family protein [Caenimonas sp. SL110]
MQDWVWYLDKWNMFGWLVLVIVLERLFPARPGKMLNRGWGYDLIHMYDPWIRSFIIGAAALLLTPYLKALPFAGVMASKSIWFNFLVLIVVSESTFYAVHRATHKYPLLWEFHRVHHSSSTYYSLMTSRFHVLDACLFAIPYVLVAAYLGVRGEALMAMSVFQGFSDRYVHGNIKPPRFTGYIFSNPTFHSWHHSNHPEARNKNFSRDFSFMDWLFGTAYYPEGKIPTVFGEPSYPVNYFVQQGLPFYNIYKRFKGKPKAAPKHLSAPVSARATPELIQSPVAER